MELAQLVSEQGPDGLRPRRKSSRAPQCAPVPVQCLPPKPQQDPDGAQRQEGQEAKGKRKQRPRRKGPPGWQKHELGRQQQPQQQEQEEEQERQQDQQQLQQPQPEQHQPAAPHVSGVEGALALKRAVNFGLGLRASPRAAQRGLLTTPSCADAAARKLKFVDWYWLDDGNGGGGSGGGETEVWPMERQWLLRSEEPSGQARVDHEDTAKSDEVAAALHDEAQCNADSRPGASSCSAASDDAIVGVSSRDGGLAELPPTPAPPPPCPHPEAQPVAQVKPPTPLVTTLSSNLGQLSPQLLQPQQQQRPLPLPRRASTVGLRKLPTLSAATHRRPPPLKLPTSSAAALQHPSLPSLQPRAAARRACSVSPAPKQRMLFAKPDLAPAGAAPVASSLLLSTEWPSALGMRELARRMAPHAEPNAAPTAEWWAAGSAAHAPGECMRALQPRRQPEPAQWQDPSAHHAVGMSGAAAAAQVPAAGALVVAASLGPAAADAALLAQYAWQYGSHLYQTADGNRTAGGPALESTHAACGAGGGSCGGGAGALDGCSPQGQAHLLRLPLMFRYPSPSCFKAEPYRGDGGDGNGGGGGLGFGGGACSAAVPHALPQTQPSLSLSPGGRAVNQRAAGHQPFERGHAAASTATGTATGVLVARLAGGHGTGSPVRQLLPLAVGTGAGWQSSPPVFPRVGLPESAERAVIARS